MVKYGYSSITNERICYEYTCDYCGKHLGEIKIIHDDNGTKEQDDIMGWNFCPYCGEPLWARINMGGWQNGYNEDVSE